MIPPADTSSRPVKVYIATPTHDHKITATYADAVLALIGAELCTLQFAKVGGMGVARARNNMAQEFLAGDADVYLAWDSDIHAKPEHVARVVASCLRLNAVVCGPYALKQAETAWCLNLLPGEQMDPETYLQKVQSAGTGFMAIPRAIFVAMIDAYPEIAYAEDIPSQRGTVRWDFFAMGVHRANEPLAKLERIREKLGELNQYDAVEAIRAILDEPLQQGRYLSEDYFFCHRVRELGYPIFVDLAVILRHEGIITFPLAAAEASDNLRNELDSVNARMKALSPWPATYNVAPDHCLDVLRGSYEVPFTPPAPPVILDIGANVGAFSIWASKRWPGAIIHAFEPHPENFALLLETLQREKLENVRALELAVGESGKVGFLRKSLTNCGAHSLFETGEVSTGDGVNVEVMDAAMLPPADILKIDAEGAELPILRRLWYLGALRNFAAIMLEYHSDDDAADIRALLTGQGFRICGEKVICRDRGELKFVRGE